MNPHDRYQRLSSVVVFIVAISWSGSALAQKSYKCEDDKGSVTFQSVPCSKESLLPERCRHEDSIFHPDYAICSAIRTCRKKGLVGAALTTCIDSEHGKLLPALLDRMEQRRQQEELRSRQEADRAKSQAEARKRGEEFMRNLRICEEARRNAYVEGVNPLPTCDHLFPARRADRSP